MASELTTLRLAGGAQGFNWLPVFVAEERGLFTKHGIAIEYQRLGSVDKATTAVKEKTADLAITPPEGAIADFVAGGDLRVIAANSLRLPMSLVARPEIKTLADVAGKRIGTSSLTEGTAVYAQMMLQQVGLTYPGDYEFVLAGVHTARWAALQQGEIDCAPQPAPWNFLAEREGYSLIGEVNDVIPDVIFAALIANASWLEENHDVAQRLVSALAEAHALVNDKQQDGINLPIYQRLTTPDDSALAARGLAYTRDMGMWPTDAVVTPTALAVSIDVMVRAGLLEESARDRASSVLDSSFLATV